MYLLRNLDTRKPLYLCDPTINFMRRVLPCFIFVLMSNHSGQQIQLALFINISILTFNRHQSLYTTRMMNRINTMNDCFVMLFTYTFVWFTDYCSSLSISYYLGGYSCIIIIFLVLLINMAFIFYPYLRGFIIILTVWFKRFSKKPKGISVKEIL